MTLTTNRARPEGGGMSAPPALASGKGASDGCSIAAPSTCASSCEIEPDFDNLLDPARLRDLFEEIGGEDLADIVELFLEETDGIITRIAASAAGPELAADLHFLKGCALNLGLAALAGLCREAERCNACGRAAPLDSGSFLLVYDASKLALHAALEAGRPG